MSTVPDPQVVREIAREAMQRAARRRDYIGSVLSEHAIMDEILASGDRSAYRRWCDAIEAEMQSAAVTVSWPEEQARAECCDSRAHHDFVGDQDIRCELPDGHFWHRNGERTWTP